MDALVAFIKAAQKIVNSRRRPLVGNGVLSVSKSGDKYIRISVTIYGQESSFCWIDKTNGNVLKGSWKAPEVKNPRSNIFDKDHGLSGIGPYGVKYMTELKRKGRT